MRMSANKDNNGEPDTDAVYIRNQFEYDRMQSIHEDIVAIEKFHEMKDSTADTIIYTVFVFETLITVFLAGMITEHYYIIHSIKLSILLPVKYYLLKKDNLQYRLIELCYYTHGLIMFYIWSPWKPPGLFPALFFAAHGPLIWAIYFWRFSFVPHSIDKMGQLFFQTSPAICTWSMRWYSTPDQGFALCANPTEPGVNGCNNIGWDELLLYPFILYGIWLLCYVLIVFYWKAKVIEKNTFSTAATAVLSKDKRAKGLGMIYTLTHLFGPKYQTQMYFVTYTIMGFLFCALAYLCFISFAFNCVFFFTFVLVACYNGATFYIKVVGKEYYKNEEKKNE
ncbi:PREDICTED: uncharacterized membrane protein C776.05-like isoform X2 [Amphimedon queenslandica]|uniref:Glycerophosphocholine acyltransferase 1 n=2 Tax=Amphimedon queenslandica TaxID=400682 RepID=A0AAN0IQ75_AMPQE|nr:PREDICTED: uncharacterized membrane protein C776.05-like isoform X2 [Amphimedon queenslandica]|eukprot:XP_011407063.2 PREDICTED: uncharacterized membrane protein C776.05-like isoform X2 [Amphimedon queenslandica]